MSKAKLIFDLIMYINTKRVFTAQDVAYEFNVSVRTAHRYLSEISELGVPLYTDQGRNGGYRILNSRVLPPVIFNENEASAIFFAFQALKYYKYLPFDTNIDSASRKLFFSLPEDAKKKIRRLEDVLSFWNQKRGIASLFLEEVIEAAIEDNVLKIEYESKTENTEREVKPIGVYAYDGFWYMPALDIQKDKVQLFRVDRILNLENTKRVHEFQMNLTEWFKSYPINAPVRVYVELTREGKRQCKGTPWLESDIVITEDEKAYIDTTIDKSELEFITNYFFQLGHNAKVIEPQEVVEGIRQRAFEILEHYSE